MNYWNTSPVTGVWEITMGCNMRCKHCGSSCENALDDEMTTDEALQLCDDLKELGFQWITLSGGEPTVRKDWDVIAHRLAQNGIIPNMITNGWLMDEATAHKAKNAGINTLAFSLDGLKETHDFIRKAGSFDRIMQAIDICLAAGLNISIITTVNKMNFNELPAMHALLSGKGLYGWQLQIGLPMGNMASIKEQVLLPEDVDPIIDFAHEAMLKGGIEMQLADCLGYFNKKEIEVRKRSTGVESYGWNGCGAGKYVLGILHNGDVVGCTSIRSPQFIEGNVRKTPIIEMWKNPAGFAWNRGITKGHLDGMCAKCSFGHQCLGGCANTRITMNGSVESENRYCSYNNVARNAEAQFSDMADVAELMQKAEKFIANESLQLAGFALERVLALDPEHEDANRHYGFVSFMLGNYKDALAANEVLMQKDPLNPYHNKGYGLTIAKMGNVEDGIRHLNKAIELSNGQYMDAYHDLAVVLFENDRIDEAIRVLEDGGAISTAFSEQTEGWLCRMKQIMGNYGLKTELICGRNK